MNDWTNRILWAVYLSLLGVLLPHTAWAFANFEPGGMGSFLGLFDVPWGNVTAWAAAFAFEAAIAALTHKLAKHIEDVPKHKSAWLRWRKRYLNAYSVGLVAAVGISAMANLAHAVEFGRELAIFVRWGVPFGVYSVAFGAILPLVSLLFARVLSNVVDGEVAANPELERANQAIQRANQTVAELRRQLRETERRASVAEERFGAAGDLFVRLFADEKRQRIAAAAQMWPALAHSAIAVIAGSSPSYVSEVLGGLNDEQN